MDERFVAAFDYELPPSLIAQAPAVTRDSARLLVVGENGAFEDRIFSELPTLLRAGDLLVLNETRVIAARLRARRESGGAVEMLLLHPSGATRYDPRALSWIALLRPAKRIHDGEHLSVLDSSGATIAVAQVTAVQDDGAREVRFEGDLPFEKLLERAGRLPLPPYIHNDSDEAQARYQTVFARVPGSVAAPTAALHFTPEVLFALDAHGIEMTKLTLDVGVGTFRPMQSEYIDDHRMHAEHYALSQESVERIETARAQGRRVVAVGTTVVRALEGNVAANGSLRAGAFATDLFITPGFAFRVVDALITNFHLPRSTLLVLVSAFAGREHMLDAYRVAIERGYRFFSFGDAMLVSRRG